MDTINNGERHRSVDRLEKDCKAKPKHIYPLHGLPTILFCVISADSRDYISDDTWSNYCWFPISTTMACFDSERDSSGMFYAVMYFHQTENTSK